MRRGGREAGRHMWHQLYPANFKRPYLRLIARTDSIITYMQGYHTSVYIAYIVLSRWFLGLLRCSYRYKMDVFLGEHLSQFKKRGLDFSSDVSN